MTQREMAMRAAAKASLTQALVQLDAAAEVERRRKEAATSKVAHKEPKK
jgi:hypothetical protein